jgi:hypothetical protein
VLSAAALPPPMFPCLMLLASSLIWPAVPLVPSPEPPETSRLPPAKLIELATRRMAPPLPPPANPLLQQMPLFEPLFPP